MCVGFFVVVPFVFFNQSLQESFGECCELKFPILAPFSSSKKIATHAAMFLAVSFGALKLRGRASVHCTSMSKSLAPLS